MKKTEKMSYNLQLAFRLFNFAKTKNKKFAYETN